MIENLFGGGGGGGGGLQGVTAGTGISVDNTNPDNPIITNTSLNTDEVAKVSSNDTTAGYLNGKLVAGSGIGFTENNNGGNETLTVAVSNLDAGAITTGTIATARLGTGTADSTTYLAGDQTYKTPPYPVTSVAGKTGAVALTNTDVGAAAASHTHAASHITSGVIATPRLGSGAANSLTALFGDQTYKNVVTSVNGSNGAVTVSPGDTAYSMTVQDAENTTATRNLCQFTIPASTFADGELIKVQLWYQANNLSGVAGNRFQVGFGWTGASFGEYNAGSLTGSENGRFGIAEFWFTRNGSTMGSYNAGGYGIYNSSPYSFMQMGSTFFPAYVNHVLDTRNWSFSPTTFTSNITVSITGRWETANASAYVRILNARAFKVSGQQT